LAAVGEDNIKCGGSNGQVVIVFMGRNKCLLERGNQKGGKGGSNDTKNERKCMYIGIGSCNRVIKIPQNSKIIPLKKRSTICTKNEFACIRIHILFIHVFRCTLVLISMYSHIPGDQGGPIFHTNAFFALFLCTDCYTTISVLLIRICI
jgi:hypothetical protein